MNTSEQIPTSLIKPYQCRCVLVILQSSFLYSLMIPNYQEFYTNITLLGLQVRHVKELRNDECKPPVFLYENCVFTISQGYESIQTLEEAGYRLVPKVYQDVTKSMLGNGGFPRLTLVPTRSPTVAEVRHFRTTRWRALWCMRKDWRRQVHHHGRYIPLSRPSVCRKLQVGCSKVIIAFV